MNVHAINTPARRLASMHENARPPAPPSMMKTKAYPCEEALAAQMAGTRNDEGWMHPMAIPRVLASEPWLTTGQIAERLGIHGSQVHSMMQKLQRDKVTQCRKDPNHKGKYQWALVGVQP